jgi:hypothetical protein
MNDYRRRTEQRAFAQLEPPLREAITAHAAAQLMDDPARSASFCCQTESERLVKPGLLTRLLGSADPDPVHHSAAVIAGGRLIVARAGAKFGRMAMSAPLADVALSTLPGLPALAGGVSVTAPWSQSAERGSYFVALEDGPVAQAFLAALREAVAAAKR